MHTSRTAASQNFPSWVHDGSPIEARLVRGSVVPVDRIILY